MLKEADNKVSTGKDTETDREFVEGMAKQVAAFIYEQAVEDLQNNLERN